MKQNPLFFSGYEYYLEHNDENAPSLESILDELDGFVSVQGLRYSSEDMKELIGIVEKNVQHIEMTIDQYRISGEKRTAVYTQERQKLHDEIINEFVLAKIKQNTITDNPRILITLGGRPGSGKSSCFRDVVYDDSFIVLDPDEIKAKLPEYKGWNAEEVHEESGDILEKCLQLCKNNNLNVVIETTMGTVGSALRRIREFKESGYKVEAHYMFLPMRQACKRAMERFLNGAPNGRYIPIEILHQMNENEKNFDLIKPFVDGWSFYSNENSDKTGKPELIAEYGDIYLKQNKEKQMKEHFENLTQAVQQIKKEKQPYLKPDVQEISGSEALDLLAQLKGNQKL